ncbi:MAG: SIS domain-containing protein [Alphaproteobacteria bacterium]
MKAFVRGEIGRTVAVLQAMGGDDRLLDAVRRASEIVVAALAAGGKVMLCGNGGSAADAQHLAGELVGRFQRERAGLAALALTADTAVVTAIGNDFGFEHVFARQVAALGRPGDVLIALSTSGRSPNVLRALEQARAAGVATIGMTGGTGGGMGALCEVCLRVPAEATSRIQEGHIVLGHILCALIEREAPS